MKTDYIPLDDRGKLRWIINFNQWLQANGAGHGFSPADIAAMATHAGDFGVAMSANQTAQNAAKAATQTKNAARASAITLGRAYAQKIQSDLNTTDADRAAAGLTVPDTTITRTAPDSVKTIPPPVLILDFSLRRQVTVHWGPNPGNERENGRPAGTLGCEVQVARGGIPSDEAAWEALEIDGESPLVHAVNETEPTTFAYRARYFGKNLKFGPFGDPATCTVSV